MPGGGRRKKKKRRGRSQSTGGFRPSGDSGAGKVLLINLFGSGGKEVSERLAGMLLQDDGSEIVVGTLFISRLAYNHAGNCLPLRGCNPF